MSRNKNKNKYRHLAVKSPSTVKSTATVSKHTRTEVDTDFEPLITLTEEFTQKVSFLHQTVSANTEWSAILLYTNKKGSVDDPNNWEIEVNDLILMDIGSSVYTEYDMDSDDTYATDKWQDHLEAGGKIGHLHTHHNMTCYFSGTDMGELHDNAPSHNYYLSLIVNYRDTSNWCAKVAICGERKRAGVIKTTTSWTGAKGTQTKLESDDIESVEEMLFLMDCKIQKEKSEVVKGLQGRIDEINALKTYTATKPYVYKPYVPANHSRSTPGYNQKPYIHKPFTQSGSPAEDTEEEALWRDVMNSNGEAITPQNAKIKSIEKHKTINEAFTPGIIVPIFCKWLTSDLDNVKTLSQCLLDLEQSDTMEMTIEDLSEEFKSDFALFFSMELTPLHMHAIAVSLYDALIPFESMFVYGPIDSLLTSHLMTKGGFSPIVIKTMTGIDPKDQICMEPEEIK